MRLCHDGEISSYVVFIIIIITIKIRRLREGGGVVLWCGYALAWGAGFAWVLFLIFVAAVLCGFHRWWAFSYGLCMLPILYSYGNPCAQSLLFPIVCAWMSSILGLRSTSVALCVAVHYKYPIPSGTCSLSLGTVFFSLLVYTHCLIWSLVCHLFSLFIWLVVCPVIAGSTLSCSVLYVWVVRSAFLFLHPFITLAAVRQVHNLFQSKCPSPAKLSSMRKFRILLLT